MSPMFNKINRYYDYKLWTIKQVKNAVVHRKITAEEYKTITESKYNN